MTEVDVLDEGSMCNKNIMYEVVSARPYLLFIIWMLPDSGSDIRQEYGQFLSYSVDHEIIKGGPKIGVGRTPLFLGNLSIFVKY
jgi:hypothetical protein